MRDGSDAVADWPLLNALLNTASGATWVSIHHGGGVGMGYSQHAGVVIVCDGTPAAAKRIERVLWNDPASGVMRHADAGYADADRLCARARLESAFARMSRHDEATQWPLWSSAPSLSRSAQLKQVYRSAPADSHWQMRQCAASHECHEVTLRLAAQDKPAYGINTGFGLLAQTRIPPQDRALLQKNIVLSHSAGVGPLLDDAVVRLTLVLKLASLLRGYSGVSAELAPGAAETDRLPRRIPAFPRKARWAHRETSRRLRTCRCRCWDSARCASAAKSSHSDGADAPWGCSRSSSAPRKAWRC